MKINIIESIRQLNADFSLSIAAASCIKISNGQYFIFSVFGFLFSPTLYHRCPTPPYVPCVQCDQ